MSFVPLVRLWLWVSAFAVAAGWTLSAFGQLNRTGYGIAFAAFVIFLLAGRNWFLTARIENRGLKIGGHFPFSIFHLRFRALARRFRRPLPLCFAALAVLIFLGGALYPPSNYTGLNYRVARVLQWLAHDHWFWVHTENYRMNDRACGFEWLTAPLLLFTKSDRALFLVNFIPFLLLPGLVFSIFTRLGVRARVAWQWMWLLPTGYNFLLQAGSIANDTFPTAYALAAVDFAARAWRSRRTADVWHSILAAALLTGAKPSNLPLLLPWAILIFAVLPLLRKKIVATAFMILLAALVSFLPMAILNIHYCGDWSGAKLEPAFMIMKNPWVGLWGHSFQILLVNFIPPIFPLAGWWNLHAPLFMPHFMVTAADNYFDGGFFAIGELPTEDWAGLGFGVSLLLAVAVLGKCGMRRGECGFRTEIPAALCRCVLLAAWVSLAVYCMKSGMTTTARLIAPYYPLLLPLLLIGPAQSEIIRRWWWRGLVGVVLIFAFIIVIVVPDRPLWPAKTILSKAHARYPDQRLINRALKVYTVYSERSDSLAGVRALLPPDIKVVGFLGGEDDCDISLWRPFGERRVEHFQLTDSAAQF
ncbi:MAG: hypothetical protein PHY43_06110, partial [Verrucomicrobiales bacterium]|nr:hypothetical protein [Verrucomicrobiales bacterium]